MQTTIEITEGKIAVSGPYSPNNNDTWRTLGGKFSGGKWLIPDTETARAKIAELFGTKSDIITAAVPALSLEGSQILQVGGYVIAQRRYRDSHVEMPDGVTLAMGTLRSSGGSVKSPRVSADNNVVFHLQCRRSFAEAQNLTVVTAPAVSSIEI